MGDATTIIKQWQSGRLLKRDAVQDLIDLMGDPSRSMALDQIPVELLSGIADELDRRPHTEEQWKQLGKKNFFHIGGGIRVPPRRLSAEELSKMRATTEAARTRLAEIDIDKVRALVQRGDIYLRQKAIEAAQIAWGGKCRDCPKCGCTFSSVGDRGQCPNCCHVFFASSPEGKDST